MTTVLLHDECGEDSDFCDLITVLGATAGFPIGSFIDQLIKRPLYISPQSGAVTVVPFIGRERAGVAATIRF